MKDSSVTPKSDPSVDSGSVISDSSEESSDEVIHTLDKLEFVLSEDEAFYFVKAKGTDILGEVVIPEEIDGIPVAVINEEAFENCDKVTSVVIPDTVETIDDEAFKGCALLSSIRLPLSLKYMSNYLFTDCDALTTIRYDGTVEQWEDVTKEEYWYKGAHTTVVECKDGHAPIE